MDIQIFQYKESHFENKVATILCIQVKLEAVTGKLENESCNP